MTEKIHNGVMRIHRFDDSVIYRIACTDGDQDHDLTFEMEFDKEFNMIFLNFYKKLVWSSYWQADNWFKRQWVKLGAIYNIVFFGYTEVEESFIINDPERMELFIHALIEGKAFLEKKETK